MKSLGRFGLLILTNILIIVTISIVLNILGVRPYLTAQGIDYASLAIFCLIWGMVGSFISLALSRIMAKWMMGVRVIDHTNAGELVWLVQMVHELSKKAGLPGLPEVGIYQSPDVNAFATGPSKRRSLVAVSTGLLSSMSRDQIEGVIGHEVAHIANGDMVTMTLIQGVVNAFVMFLSRVIAYFVSQAVKEDARPLVHMLVYIVMDIVLGILATILVFWFSRKREFRADRGSAVTAGREKMISALEALQKLHRPVSKQEPASLAAFKISGGARKGLLALFSTHPPLEERIARLKAYQ